MLPVLAGVLTVFSLAVQNFGKVPFADIWLPALLAGAYGLIVYLLFMIIPFFRRAAPVTATYIVLMTMLWTLIPLTPYLPLMVSPIFIVLVSAIPATQKLIPKASLVTGISCILCLAVFSVGSMMTGNQVMASNSVDMESTPDIYFIVPDRFPSPVALRETGENPDAFIQALLDLGFYVREDGTSDDSFRYGDKISSTTRTGRYFASVLNMGKPVDYWIPYLEAESLAKNSATARILQANGYTYHHIGSWYPETAYSLIADYNYIYPSYSIASRLNGTLFAAAVIDRSGFRTMNFIPFLTDSARMKTETGRQLFQISTFEEIAAQSDSPKFVLLHLLLPHPDYYWMADGSPSDLSLTPEARYMQQVRFTETKLLEMIGAIHDDEAIIIIQSDEGMVYIDNELNKDLSLTQWNGTLSAWRIPCADKNELATVRNTDILKYVIEGLENAGIK